MRTATALCLCLLAACAGNAPAPIEERSGATSAPRESRYRVLRGDTLYSIAFRYGLDYRGLAAANDIAAPYTIYVGQSLLLAEAEPPPRSRAPAPRPASTAPASGSGASGTSASATASATGAAPRAAAKPSPAKTAVATATVRDNVAVSAWRWPAAGRVERRFDGTRHKGIDLGGERGDEIRAVAAGRVVYAGSGIAGYGLMLIVRHNDEYLSAYGHNDAVLVDEGEAVAAGQVIARMGSSGTDSVKLHFELRKQGKPVDPLRLLPRR